MKKVGMTFLIISVLFVGTTVAQPAAGGLFVGGSFNFSTIGEKAEAAGTTTEISTEMNFGIAPKVGFFISDNLAIGAGVGYSIWRWDDLPDNEIVRASLFEITPFARYYLGGEKFGLFGEGIISLGFGGSSVTDGNITTEGNPVNYLTIGAIPGVYYFISENFALEAQFGFLGLERTVETSGQGAAEIRSIESGFSFELNPSTISFGLIYRL